MRKSLLVPVLLALLAGCAPPVTWVGLPPGETLVQGRMAVKVDDAWSRLEGAQQPKHDAWTSDGLSLDQLHFYAGLAEGESFVAVSAAPADKPIPRFRADMEAQEVVEFYESYASRDGSVFKVDKVAPAPFGDKPGFRFEFSRIRRSDEVRLKGVGYGVIQGGELFLMVFEAPRIHYFAKHAARVDAIAQSMRIRPKG